MYNKKIIDEIHLFVAPKKIGISGISMYTSKRKFSLHKHNKSLVNKKKFIKDTYFHYNL